MERMLMSVLLLCMLSSIISGKIVDIAKDNENLFWCEDLFLLDGVGPQYLPDTWSEARERFRSLCFDEEFALKDGESCEAAEHADFYGHPADSTAFTMDLKLCQRLRDRAVHFADIRLALSGADRPRRRMKGTYVSGGGDSDTTPFRPPVSPRGGSAYLLTQGDYCLDFNMGSFKLGLYGCKAPSSWAQLLSPGNWGKDNTDNANQMFVWRSIPGSEDHQIYTPEKGGWCLSVMGSQPSGPVVSGQMGAKPASGTEIGFQKCGASDQYSRWTYNFVKKRLSLAAWPDLCFDFNEQTRAFGVFTCLKDQALNTKYNQVVSFEMPDRRHGVSPTALLDNKEHLLTQGGYCLSYDRPASSLVLFDCEYQQNQVFVWKPVIGSTGHQLAVGSRGLYCVAVNPSGAVAGGRPANGAKVMFSDCSKHDKYETWAYDASRERLSMAAWPDLCVDYDEKQRFFGVWSCALDGPKAKYNQIVKVEEFPVKGGSSSYVLETSFETPPVEPTDNGAYCLTQKGFCLDLNLNNNGLGLYDCKLADNDNQMFLWHSEPGWDYHQIIAPAKLMLCLTVEVGPGQMPPLGTPAVFKQCGSQSRWKYNFTTKSMFMAAWPQLCLTFSDVTKAFTVTKCKVDEGLMKVGGLDFLLDYKQAVMFEMPDRRFGVPSIPPEDNQSYLMTQDGWCLTHDAGSYLMPRASLLLYTCVYDPHQAFIWKNAGTGHQIVPWWGSECLSVESSGALSNARPENGRKVGFTTCVLGNTYQTWSYDVNMKSISLTAWRDLCLDFGASNHYFVVWPCELNGASVKPNQVINIEKVPHVRSGPQFVNNVPASDASFYSDKFELLSLTNTAARGQISTMARVGQLSALLVMVSAAIVLRHRIVLRQAQFVQVSQNEESSQPLHETSMASASTSKRDEAAQVEVE